MNNISENLFQDAAGKIDYTLMNDYMFRAVLQEHENVLKGLIASLLHLNPEAIKSTTVLNPIELGKDYSDKTFVLDIKVLLNDAAVVNLEMQVAGQDFLNFSPFPDYPEFYATNQMMNIKKHYIYNDNFTLNVLDLNQIHLATEEDKAYKIDYWAKLFKAKTWEDLKMLAQNNNVFEEACEAVYKLNQDPKIRYLCEMHEEGQRILRTYQNMLKAKENALAKMDAVLAEKNTALAERDTALAERDTALAEKDIVLAENAVTIAALQDQIRALQDQVERFNKQA